MAPWQRLFGGLKTSTRAPDTTVAKDSATGDRVISQMLAINGNFSSRRKDVEALCFAALNAIAFIKRHKLTYERHIGMGDVDFYCYRVGATFRLAAQKIMPADDVNEIISSYEGIGTPLSDDEMSTVFTPLLDEAIALIGRTHEIMPLAYLKTDLEIR